MSKGKIREVEVTVKNEKLGLTLGKKVKKVLLNYLTTQFVLMVIVGFTTWGILTLLHVSYPILLAVITGVLSGVPGYGMLLANLANTLVAIFDKTAMWINSPAWLEGVIVLATFFVLNKIVDLVITPIFLGKTNNINPFIAAILTIFGTLLAGVPGAILAIPVYLVVRTTVKHFNESQ